MCAPTATAVARPSLALAAEMPTKAIPIRPRNSTNGTSDASPSANSTTTKTPVATNCPSSMIPMRSATASTCSRM
ncbi:hypothetical protein [Halorientalis sp.]|uniref:hypothetical protein n=1 Tax=Halorientalis sp. TaxID=1931229 RepID=UPI0032C2385C